MTFAVLALLALYWALHRERGAAHIADVLAINWALNEAVVMANGGWPVLPMFVLVDFVCGVALASRGRGVELIAAAFFMPMIVLNSTAFMQGPLPEWHYTALFALAWGQALVVACGVWGDGLATWLDSVRRGRRARYSLGSDRASVSEGEAQ